MTNKLINRLFLEDCKALVERRFDDGSLGDFVEANAEKVLSYLAEKLGSFEEPNYLDAIRVFHELYLS